MLKPLHLFLKTLYNRILPWLFFTLALLGLWFVGQRLETPVFDALMRWTSLPAKNSPVVLVLIDDASVKALKLNKNNPYSGSNQILSVLPPLLQALQQAKPASLIYTGSLFSDNLTEGLLDNPNNPYDDYLLSQLRLMPNVFLGWTASAQPFKRGKDLDLELNWGILALEEDPDGVVRGIRPIEQTHNDLNQRSIFPALSLAVVLDWLQQTANQGTWLPVTTTVSTGLGSSQAVLNLLPEHTSLSKQALKLPMTFPLEEPNQRMLLRWSSLRPKAELKNLQVADIALTHKALRLADLFEPGSLKLKGFWQQQLSQKIVLISPMGQALWQTCTTPVSPKHLSLDAHATAIDTMLHQQTLRRLPVWQSALVLLLMFAVVFVIRWRVQRTGMAFLYGVGCMVLYFWWAFNQFARGLVLDVATPEIFMLVAFIIGTLAQERLRDRQVERLENNLSQLVSQAVLNEIRRLDYVLEPGGYRQEITSLFVDLRNFTAFSQDQPAHVVTGLLNEFYTVIEALVFNHRGTVDKFMGDGVLAMFGAPLPNQQHAQQALAAAQAILQQADQLLSDWQKRYGSTVSQLDWCVTLNTGPAFVGFLGPAQKLEYTAVGDTVNVCVRLQDVAKQLSQRLLLSETTAQKILREETLHQTLQGFTSLGPVVVRGREQPLEVFTTEPA